MTSKSQLKSCRQQIDQIDKEIVNLLIARFAIAKDIASIKKDMKKDVCDKKREQEVIEKAIDYAGDEFNQEIASVFKSIIQNSKAVQNRILCKTVEKPNGRMECLEEVPRFDDNCLMMVSRKDEDGVWRSYKLSFQTLIAAMQREVKSPMEIFYK